MVRNHKYQRKQEFPVPTDLRIIHGLWISCSLPIIKLGILINKLQSFSTHFLYRFCICVWISCSRGHANVRTMICIFILLQIDLNWVPKGFISLLTILADFPSDIQCERKINSSTVPIDPLILSTIALYLSIKQPEIIHKIIDIYQKSAFPRH